jgi:hypothetical protein
LSLTLPEDTVAWLRSRHQDVAWAIVQLCEQELRRAKKPLPRVDLLHLPNGQALILVEASLVRHLGNVQLLPLSDGRGLLTFADGQGPADMELELADRLEQPGLSTSDIQEIGLLRTQLRDWRLQGIRFERRSIVVASGVPRRPTARPQPGRTPGP